MRVKVTRVEIWEVTEENKIGSSLLQDLQEGITDDILNSQDNEQLIGDLALDSPISIVPREIVEVKVEEDK